MESDTSEQLTRALFYFGARPKRSREKERLSTPEPCHAIWRTLGSASFPRTAARNYGLAWEIGAPFLQRHITNSRPKPREQWHFPVPHCSFASGLAANAVRERPNEL